MLLEYKVAPHYGDICELNPDCHINGEPLDYNDFVRKYDHDKAHAQEFGCGDMRCDIKTPTQEVLDKYCITHDFLSKFYWSGQHHLWTRGYFASTIGDVSEKTLVQYIKNQS